MSFSSLVIEGVGVAAWSASSVACNETSPSAQGMMGSDWSNIYFTNRLKYVNSNLDILVLNYVISLQITEFNRIALKITGFNHMSLI